MIGIKISVRGDKEVVRSLKGLSRDLRRELSRTSDIFMKSVQKSAKLRAPRQSGDLSRSIILRKIKNTWIINVESPYGIYQEEGFRPHTIHASMSSKNSLGTVGSAMGLHPSQMITVKKSKPFVQPALEANLARLDNKLIDAVDRAIRK